MSKKPNLVAKSQDEVAECFRVSRRTITYWRSCGMPSKIGQYDLAKITQWHLGRVAARHRRSDPDLSSDSSSPALEQYRQERAKLAKLDRIDREASLVDREKSLTMWRAMLVVLRRAAVRIGKAHGDEARSIVDEGLDEADRIAQQFAD